MDTVNGPAASVVARPLDFPDAPTGLAAVAGGAQATLTWTITSDTSVTGYQVSSDGGTTFAVIPDSDATTIEYTVTGLTNGTAYTFTLRAVNINGNGPSSDTATATPEAAPPAVPTGLRTLEGDGKVLLTWDQPADSTIIKYQVSRNGGTTFADFPYSSKAANGYNFTGLTNGTEYTFALRAVNADGIGPHATVMATPAAYGGVGLDPATAITADLTVYYDGPGGTRTGTITLSSVTGGEVTNLRILGTISPPDCWYIAWTTDAVGEIRAWVFAVHLTTTGVNTDNVPLIWRAAPERLSPDTSPDVGLDHYISLTWNRAADSTIGWYEYRQKAG